MAATQFFPLLFLSLSLFLFLHKSSSLPNETLLTAAEILSNSGYVSMSLTLQLVATTSLIPDSPSLTIFSPPDSVFAAAGQPSLSLLQCHISPLSISLLSLKSFPTGYKIPTLFSNHSLVVTSSSSDPSISLNDVNITRIPVYNDGSLVIFGIDQFFDPNFVYQPSKNQTGKKNFQCSVSSVNSFREASEALRREGYSFMASFLDSQLLGFSRNQAPLTIFAPVDEVMRDLSGKIESYPTMFLRHVAPCKILGSDFSNLDDGSSLGTFLDGFQVTVTRSGDILMLNEVPISFQDLYVNAWIVVHGIRGAFDGPERLQQLTASPATEPSSEGEGDLMDDRDNGEF